MKINRAEACELIGSDVRDAASAAAAIFGLWGRDVVVTDGVHGGAARMGGHAMSFPPPSTLGRFPAGSGDAFLGGLVVALERGDPWPDALRLALGAAAANAELPGAGALDAARATSLATRAAIREI